METIEAILKRKSIRKYSDKEISQQDLETILRAGMAGPSAVNVRPWHFYVIRDKELLSKVADGNGNAAKMLKNANVGIVVCGDTDLAFSKAPEYWVIDGAIATQNMILAAYDLGIGSVWLGTWPQSEKVENQKAILNMPANHIPHSIVAFGYPESQEEFEAEGKGKLELNKVHFM